MIPLKAYNARHNVQGSITHIAAMDGTLVAEYSYDPWGRMRDPATHSLYAAHTEPSLMLGRGYTGHEHLNDHGLINMNARLYDPWLAIFLSPDPYVQSPDLSIGFNRYTYCLNNPLKYTYESGEVFVVDDVILAAVVAFGIAYGSQVIANFVDKAMHSSSFKGEDFLDILFRDIDWLDVAVNTLLGAVSAGATSYLNGLPLLGKELSLEVFGQNTHVWEGLIEAIGAVVTSFIDYKPSEGNINVKKWNEAKGELLVNFITSFSVQNSTQGISSDNLVQFSLSTLGTISSNLIPMIKDYYQNRHDFPYFNPYYIPPYNPYCPPFIRLYSTPQYHSDHRQWNSKESHQPSTVVSKQPL